jgi:hypothetical protein
MRRVLFLCILVGFYVAIPLVEAYAQSRAGRGAILGGLTGAAIGGATRGGRGAAVGAAIGVGAGALIGGQMERRRGNYYWYNGRCWVRFRNGEFHPVSRRYCH